MGRRVLSIADTFLPVIFGNHPGQAWCVEQDPLPNDTKIINAQVKFVGLGYQTLELLLESSEWEAVECGKPYPFVDLRFKAIGGASSVSHV